MSNTLSALPADFASWPDKDQALFLMRAKWLSEARPEQLPPPPGLWMVWLLLAGRGFGKTRLAAEDMAYEGLANDGWRMGVVAPTFGDVRDTCFEGESGIISVLGGMKSRFIAKWNRSMAELELTNGTIYKGFAGDEPDRLRGPQFHRTWVDELAAMVRQDEAWANIEMCTRLGVDPKIIVTTTPRPTKLIRELLARSKPPVVEERADKALPEDALAGIPRKARSLGTRSPFLDAGPQ